MMLRVATACAVMFALPTAATAAEVGNVVRQSGALIVRDGRLIPAGSGAALQAGDRFVTLGGAAQVRGAGGCQTAVPQFSSVAATAACGASAVSLADTNARVGSPALDGVLQARGGTGGILIGVVAVIAIALGIIAASKGSTRPASR